MRNSEFRTKGTYEKQGSRKMRVVPEIFWEKEKPTAKAEHCEQQGGAKRENFDVDRATKYAKMVIAGEIGAGRLVRLACKRHLDDLKKSARKNYPYYYDKESAEIRLEFYRLCHHYKGDCAGKPMNPELWQCFIQGSVFGWKRKSDNKRRFSEVYEQIGKKNGKSTDAATTALYCMTVDGESGAEIYSAATSRDQAKIIFETARQMIMRSPELKEYVNVLTSNINVPSTASKFEPVSKEAGTLDGKDVYVGLIDELHAHKNREVYDILKGGTVARTQPLIWVVTTAGFNANGICRERYEYAKKVLEGVFEDDTLFAYIAQPDEGDDILDPKNFIKANPNLGVSVKINDLKIKAKQAREIPAAYNQFACKHMNMWVSSSVAWMNMDKWNNSGRGIEVDLLHRRCYCGVDLSAKLDLTSVVLDFPLENGYYAALHHSFIPEATMIEKEHKDNVPYSAWVRQGYLTAIPGEVIEQQWIMDYIMAQAKKYNIVEIDYDPWNASEFGQRMESEGFTCVEVRQGVYSLSEPMKDVERLAVQGKIVHFGDPVLRWAVSNIVATADSNGNIKPDKSKTTQRIDPGAALITAHSRAICDTYVDLEETIMSDDYIL